MKRNYESPVMMTEMYKVNAYCGACNKSLNGQLTTDADHAFSNNSGTPWKPKNGFSITVGDLTHTFPANPTTTSTGLCGGGMFGQGEHSVAEREQSIWECNCTTHAGETWFLEWSHYFSIHENDGISTFFLYQDTNNNGVFDIYSGSVNNLPSQSGDSDTNVALVNYGIINVINS